MARMKKRTLKQIVRLLRQIDLARYNLPALCARCYLDL
jgi:hypothetical protein